MVVCRVYYPLTPHTNEDFYKDIVLTDDAISAFRVVGVFERVMVR
jgi:hypothetical protein